MRLPFRELLSIFLEGKSTLYFLGFAIFALSASMAIVLCNIGLMDGYDKSLKNVLRAGQGDLSLYSQDGFFSLTQIAFQDKWLNQQLARTVGVIQSEAFIIHEEEARGVLVKALPLGDISYFGLSPWPAQSVMIGKTLANEFQLKVGDKVAMAFALGNSQNNSLPKISQYVVGGFYHTGLYKFDSRVIYLHEKDYRIDQNLKLDRYNKAHFFLRLPDVNDSLNYTDQVIRKMKREMSPEFIVRPYWSDYLTLFEAVQVEKKSISVVLQLIIIIALFNIVGFVYYLTDKKGTEFFVLRALGLSGRSLLTFLLQMIFLFWFISCLGSIVFTIFFQEIVLKSSWLKIPGKIYELGQLQLSLGPSVVLQVFLISLIWVLLVSVWSLFRMRRKSLVAGLREEFGT